MFSKRLAPLTLLAFATVAVPVYCSVSKRIEKKDCIIALDGSCVDSIDFTGSSNDFITSPNDDLLAFNTLPTDPTDEPLIFSDPYDTDFVSSLGTEDFGEPYSIFTDDSDLGGFQLASGDRATCTCPHEIDSSKGCVYAKPGGDPSGCSNQCCTYCCRNDDGPSLNTCRKVTDNPRCS